MNLNNSNIQSLPDRFGRFPTATELEQYELGLETKIHKNNFKLISAPDGLLVDVTHTYVYPYHSGIQRTVRSFVCALRDLGKKPILIRFNESNGQPVLLSSDEVVQFYNWNEFIFKNSHETSIVEKQLFKILKPLKEKIPSWVWSSARSFYIQLRSLLKTILTSKPVNKASDLNSATFTEVVDVRNRQIILPEVISEEYRIDSISILSKNYNVQFSAIVYDLIPLTHPEYCTIGYDFIHYLRIFRFIDRAICISKHTSNEVTKIMELISREVPSKLKIAPLYLGGEFYQDKAQKDKLDTIQKTSDNIPIILMVARFEPRKNVRRVAQAMVRLQNRGLKFKFVIIGNPGWKQEDIFNDLNYYISKGHNFEYHLKIPDAELLKWYQKSSFTIFCSFVEGLGLPIIESVLQNKPCITTNSGSQSEIAKFLGGCIEVNPHSLSEIEAATEKLLTDKDFYNLLVQQTMSSKWPTWLQYAKDFVAILET